MRILAFCPYTLDTIGGNVVTLLRLKEGLARRGHEMEIHPVSPETTETSLRAYMKESKPDVLHFFHAYKTGRFLPGLLGRPSLITFAGTDIAHDVEVADRRGVILAASEAAGVLTTYNPHHAVRIGELYPHVAEKMVVLPKGVTLGTEPFDPGIEGFLFFHPGGIRPVKNNFFAVDNLPEDAQLLFAGPVLDGEYGRRFRERISGEEWVHYREGIPHNAMGSAYARADVVLNTSLSEGMSNALIEAMSAGRPVLAADIPGNREMIEHGVTGILYRGEEDFRAQAKRLQEDAGLREALGDAARAHAGDRFSTEREVDALLEAYQAARA